MKLIPKNVIKIEQEFNTKEEIINEMIKDLNDAGYLTESEVFLVDILSRENETSTNIGNHIAIPHARSHAVENPVISYIRNKHLVKWNDSDEQGVKHVFMFAFANDSESQKEYLTSLKDIASILANPDKIKALDEFETIEEFMEIVDVKKLP